jgi:hypothetical protein
MENSRQKLQLELNEPREFSLLYDNPRTGTSNYGEWQLFALVDNDGIEYSFFSPSDSVTQQLSQFNAGDKVRIVKTAKQIGGKKVVTDYSVISANGGPLKSHLHDAPTNGNGKAVATSMDPNPDPMFALLEECYGQAMELAKKYNGIEISKAAITLFISKSKLGGHALANGFS